MQQMRLQRMGIICKSINNVICLHMLKLIKVNFLIYIADRKATIPVYRQSFFCSAVLTPQHYHWYAATRFTFPVG